MSQEIDTEAKGFEIAATTDSDLQPGKTYMDLWGKKATIGGFAKDLEMGTKSSGRVVWSIGGDWFCKETGNKLRGQTSVRTGLNLVNLSDPRKELELRTGFLGHVFRVNTPTALSLFNSVPIDLLNALVRVRDLYAATCEDPKKDEVRWPEDPVGGLGITLAEGSKFSADERKKASEMWVRMFNSPVLAASARLLVEGMRNWGIALELVRLSIVAEGGKDIWPKLPPGT